MSLSQPPTPEPTPDPPAQGEQAPQTRAQIDRAADMAKLARYADIAMEQIELAHIRATRAHQAYMEGEPPPPGPDPVHDIERVGRAMCIAIRLKAKCRDDEAFPQRSPAERVRDARRATRTHRLGRLNDIYVKARDSMPANQPDAFAIAQDISERLNDDDIDALLETHTDAEIVMILCTDVGVMPDVSRWTDEELGVPRHPELRPEPGPKVNWVPEINAAGHTVYYAGPPLPDLALPNSALPDLAIRDAAPPDLAAKPPPTGQPP